MIYLLIAGSYTPFCLVAIGGWQGWGLFGVIWALAVIGVVYKKYLAQKKEQVVHGFVRVDGLALYDLCSPALELTRTNGFLITVSRWITYSLGAVLYSFPTRYTHLIWHFFVLGDLAFIYFAVLLFV